VQSFWLLLSTFLTTLTYALVKLAPVGTAFYDIFLVRSAFMALVILVIAAVSKTSLKTRHPGLQCFRILCGVTALCVNIIAVQHMSVVLFQTLVFTAPLFVAAFGMARGVLLKRFPDPGLLLTIAAGFIGVLLVMRPGGADGSLPFIALGLFSGLCSAATGLTLRKLGSLGEPIIRTVTWFAIGCLAAGIVMFSLFSAESALSLFTEPVMLAIGLTTVGSQLAQTQGWGHGKPLLSASLQFSAVPFAALLGWAITSDTPQALTWAGIALITAAELASGLIQYRLMSRKPTVIHHTPL
jgi:S-adenosylmethionine uptake transporter